MSAQKNQTFQLSMSEIIKNEIFAPISKPQEKDVAVIGMSCVVPGANSLEDYWALIEEGKCTISDLPLERWSWIQANTATLDLQRRTIKGGFIEDIDKFDAEAFNISPREAKFLDPQQRLLLEQTWKAIEHAGYNPESLANTKTGVFIGISTTDYQQIIESTANYDSHYTTGTVHSLAANRISYFFDFHGPSEAFNTACSSSLVALNRAVSAIKQGECDLAIVGGVNALLHPGLTIAFAKAGMLSENGVCKTFDEGAEGYVRGEGTGVIILKSLSKAIEDKDYIYGVIKGSAVNHGGHVRSLTVPSANAQCDVIVSALKNANISMDTLTYIEAHGTGTKLGDPIEMEGLKRAYMQSKSNNATAANKACAVASIKSNIGHLEAAAGIVGLIKILLMMQYEKIPVSMHFNQLNQYIDLTGSPFYIPTETKNWPKMNVADQEVPRRAGVSSFGFGGANVHVVIEEFIGNKSRLSQDKQQVVELPFIFSAKTEAKLKNCLAYFMQFLAKENNAPLVNIAYSLASYAQAGACRIAFVAATKAELLKQIQGYLSGENEESAISSNTYNSAFNQALDELKINLSDLIRFAYEKDNLHLLTKAWVHMNTVDWQKFFAKFTDINRAPLSLTRFNKKRYWVDIEVHPKFSTLLSEGVKPVPENKTRIKLISLENESIAKAQTKAEDKLINISLKTLNNDSKQILTNISGSLKEITRQLSEILSTVLNQNQSNLDADQPFSELGLDSILGIEFLKTVNERFKLSLKAEVLYESYTLNKLAEQVSKLSGIKETESVTQVGEKQNLNGSLLDKNKIKDDLNDSVNISETFSLQTFNNSEQALMNTSGSLKEISRQLSEILATVLSQDQSNLDANQPFTELGLDSILGIEFLKTVNERFKLSLKAEVLYESYTLNKLAEQIRKLSGTKEAASITKTVAKQNLNGLLLDKNKIINSLANTLSIIPEKVMLTMDTPFTELGLDSILGVEFIRTIAQFTHLDVRVDVLYEHYTVNKLYAYLQARLSQAAAPAKNPVDQLFEQVYAGQLSPDKAMEILN